MDTRGRPRVKCLLFIYFFVLEAAADCPTPQGGQNIVLTNEALLMNDFPEGSNATLECGKGYVEDSGSNIITCINGIWTQPDLICKKRDCGPPESQPKMLFDLTKGTLFGAVTAVSCENGYQLIGNSFKQCFATGWYGKAHCQLVTCGLPNAVANGKALWDSNVEPKYEDVIPYVCDDGYTLIGKESIVCTETGHYDSQPPECQEASSSTYSPARPTTHRDKTHTTSTTATTGPSSTEGMTTEDGHTTQTVTPASTTQEQEASSSTYSPARPTTHRDKPHTTSTTATAPSSTEGARGILTFEDKATTASVTSTTTLQDKAVETKGDNGYTPLVVCVISVTIVVCVLVGFTYKYFLRRKGSYDTKEDLKPELLQFQNL